MDKPRIEGAHGLTWRPRKNGWAAVWLARQDIAKNGYKPKTRQISVHTSALTEDDEIAITKKCLSFQREMVSWNTDRKAPETFAGTVGALITAYQTDPDSPYHGATYQSRKGFDFHLGRINAAHGEEKLADLGARDFKHWYEDARWPDGKDGRDKVSTAHGMITVVRIMLSFGYSFEIEKAPPNTMSQCARLKLILSEMKFEKGKARTEAMTLRQCEDVIAAANAKGVHSIALAQALAFDLGLRQKDIVGEYVPLSEPGISSITRKGMKWLRGIVWEEISSTMILVHKISKSRQGKVIEVDLNYHPMIMLELAKIPPEKRFGPVVICERTGKPWRQSSYRGEWRKLATIAKVPKNIFHMDNRAGRISETIEATNGNLEAARKQAGHSDIKTTQGYSRRALESNTKTAATVTEFRAKSRGGAA